MGHLTTSLSEVMQSSPGIDTWVRRTHDTDMPYLVVGHEADADGVPCVWARPLIWGIDLSEYPMMLTIDSIEPYN